MCEINPKHTKIFRLEAYTSCRDMTEEEFIRQVSNKVLAAEIALNVDMKFRFHIHEETQIPIGKCKYCGKEVSDVNMGQESGKTPIVYCSFECYCLD